MAPKPKWRPKFYKLHTGGARPRSIADTDQVDLIIRTGEGLGHSGITHASMHEWEWAKHPEGLGAVLAYRRVSPGHEVDNRKRWAEK